MNVKPFQELNPEARPQKSVLQRFAPPIALSIGLLNIALGLLTLPFLALNGYLLMELGSHMPGPLLAISFSIVGALVASHRPKNPIGWIFCAIGLSQGLVSFAYQYAQYALITAPGSLPLGPEMGILGQTVWVPGVSLMFTFGLLLFPDGRLPSPRWRIVAWSSVVPLIIFVLAEIQAWPYRGRAFFEDPSQFDPTSGILLFIFMAMFPFMLLCGLASVISLFVRFRNSQGIERQQLKWFTYAAALTLIVIILANYLDLYLDLGPFVTVLLLPIIPSIPVAAGIAIMRYRLYDIDIIINRTLVYGILTGLLALFYFSSVVGLQALLRMLTGQESQAAIVISTLAIAALFNPLRRRIQAFIDKRFYRRKYDAAKTLAAFSETARDEVDLDRLTGKLVEVVEETLQPAHVSLWLREPKHKA